MRDVVAIILGGGEGSRLFPLTRDRAKPAVPLAGKYRLIDIPVSNCINSDIMQMYVLTMYQSASLNSHLSSAFRFDSFSRGFVHPLAAEQTRTGGDWFQGTADAVRQSYVHILDTPSRRILVLSGDHLYSMDYRKFERVHVDAKADVSIAVKPVTREEARGFGVLKIDSTGRIIQFVEKPDTDEALEEMKVDTTVLGLSSGEAERRPYLASMGIYFFDSAAMNDLLLSDPEHTDFGKHIIPQAIQTHHVQAYCFDGYWADIGTVAAYYEANLDLTQPLPKFNLFDHRAPIYTQHPFLPGAKLNRAAVEGALLSGGCIVEGAMVRDSILGERTRVRPGATIERSYVIGADYYQEGGAGQPFIGISDGAYISRAIIDKNASIGRGVQLVNREGLQTYDDPEERFFVRDGIIVVPKNAIIPDGLDF